jgi:hypothetical protein
MKNLKEIGIGSFRPGTAAHGKHIKSIDLMGPTSSADAVISRRMQGHAYPKDEYHEDYNDEDEPEEEIILECRVYRNGKYCLVETLERVQEFKNFSADFSSQIKKISTAASKRKDDINRLPDLESIIDEGDLDEFSGAAAGGGGPATPLGYTAKGQPETTAQRKKRQKFNITKSFPYNSLAKQPRSKKGKRK